MSGFPICLNVRAKDQTARLDHHPLARPRTPSNALLGFPATPSQAAPRRAQPCHALPRHAMPSRAAPSPATPGRATPCLPSLAQPAKPRPAGPCPAPPSRAAPRPAEPRRAKPQFVAPAGPSLSTNSNMGSEQSGRGNYHPLRERGTVRVQSTVLLPAKATSLLCSPARSGCFIRQIVPVSRLTFAALSNPPATVSNRIPVPFVPLAPRRSAWSRCPRMGRKQFRPPGRSS